MNKSNKYNLTREKIAIAIRQFGGIKPAARALNVPHNMLKYYIRQDTELHAYTNLIQAINGYSKYETEYEKNYEKTQHLLHRWDKYSGWVLAITDLHIPYTRWKDVFRALEYTLSLKGPKIVVLGGDNLDLKWFSRFTELKENPRFTDDDVPEDIAMLKDLTDALTEIFDELIIIRGNHDLRLLKGLIRYLPQQWVTYLQPFINLYEFAENKPKTILVNDWWVRIGELIVSHYEGASVIPGRSGQWAKDYFEQRLKNAPFKVLMQAHTHKQSKIFHRGFLCIETGMLCKVPDYARSGRYHYSKHDKTYFGFGKAKLKNGKVLINSADFVYLGEEWLDE